MKETLKSYIGKALAVHHLGGEGQAAEVGIVERLSEDLLTLKQRGDVLIHIALDKIVKFRPLAGVAAEAEGAGAGVDEKVAPPGEKVEAEPEKKPPDQKPSAEQNERWEELHQNPGWHFYGQDYPSFIELIESQLCVVERHPKTTFISAHVLSYSEHLRYVAQQLEKYPNLYVDISARIGELGRQPYTSRWFLTKYADRIVFGTDITPNEKTYRIYYRCLETEDEYFEYGSNQGRYR